jgi:cysteine desulfurase
VPASIYLDYQATTPLAPEARAAMAPWQDGNFANPHSAHKDGRAAAAAIELAREQIAALLPSGGTLYFTSGATEALNWAIKGAPAGRIVYAETEHAAVRDSAEAMKSRKSPITMLPVGTDGLIAKDVVLPADAALVACMLVNNEIGVIQPIEKLAKAAHKAGALMLCDAVQGFGRVAIPEGCDMIAISAHKIHGPKGVGALWVRDGVTLAPLLHGGGQEGGLRSGTLSPALCVGFGVAAQLARLKMDEDAAHVDMLWKQAIAALPPGWEINGSTETRWHGNLNIRCEGVDSARLISELRSVAFSSGSACASGSGRPSHVLRALGLPDAAARGSIRLGFGRYTTKTELAEALRLIFSAARMQQEFATA